MDRPPPTLAEFAAAGRKLSLSCLAADCAPKRRWARHWATTLSASEAAARWGGGSTLDDLRRRARCSVCGAKGHVSIEVFGAPAAPMGADAWQAGDPKTEAWRAEPR